MATPESSLNESDVRSIVRLLGEVIASRKDHAGTKRMLMDGLCRLINADAWVWTLGSQLNAGNQPVYVGFLHGGFTEDRFARYLTAVEHPDLARLTAPVIAEVDRRGSHITRLRQQMDPEGTFLTSEAFPLWCAADVGPLMLSLYPLDQNAVVVIGLYRPKDAPVFTPREARMAHVVLSEVPWLYEVGWPEDRGATVPQLAPKERLVLLLLLDGRSRKDIAAHLNVSENTVSGYTRTIYRHFGVNSHAALLRRFQQGDGGDA